MNTSFTVSGGVTIAVTVKVHDGIVLASDSASTLMRVDEDGNQLIVNVHRSLVTLSGICVDLEVHRDAQRTWYRH